MSDTVRALVEALDTDDPRAQRQAGDRLAALGVAATGALLDALASASPRVRRSAAYLLGRQGASAPVVDALGRAVVADSEPKVRKNAAIALGTSGNTAGVPPLAAALQGESIGWVRPSLILAIGAIGGAEAFAALQAVVPQNDSEREALRKALERTQPRDRSVAWHPERARALPFLLEVPVGLEQIAIAEAKEHGLQPVVEVRPGLLRPPDGSAPWAMFSALRCVFHLLIPAGEGPSIRPDLLSTGVTTLLAGSAMLREIHRWLTSGDGTIRYRLSLEGIRVRRDQLRDLLHAVRTVCQPLGLIDSPSNYDVEIVVAAGSGPSRLFIRPRFMTDTRFAYRQKDVGASINPVVGACLARLVRSTPGATTFDPTCGSGTLLIERALLDEGSRLQGHDISRTAVAAARANIAAAGLERRIQIDVGDAINLAQWPDCDEVIANLPFGLRTGRAELDLDRLYRALLAHLAVRLKPGGRAVLYTANNKLLETCLSAQRARLRVERRLRVQSGGVWCGVWVLIRQR
jgi:tRNA1(Val) A37 N6-methylase TrmN6